MDLSLHSFILVVGLVVMAFILWDGIKKVKQSRANRLRIKLDDQFDQIAGDDTQLGSQFPNGGARSASSIDGLGDDLHADKYHELEFDDSLVGNESLSAKDGDEGSETYVTAELLNDVEQELEQMDAIEGEVSSETSAQQSVESGEVIDAHVAENIQPDDGEYIEANSSASVSEESPVTAESALVNDDSVDPITSKSDDVDFKAALAGIEEPPIEFQMLGNGSQSDVVSKNVELHSVDAKLELDEHAKKQNKKDATAKAEKLKAELAKISAAKKQLAAKKAYEDAKHQEKVEQEDEKAQSYQSEEKSTPVPMLMEPVELGDTIDPHPPEQKELTLPDQPQAEVSEAVETENQFESFSALDGDEEFSKTIDPLLDTVPEEMLASEQVGERLKDRPMPQEVLVINVLKDEGDPLSGHDLAQIFKVCDLRHGEMDIFHRFEQANAKGKIQFSVANGVEPGTFDPATIDESTTTGISFFMSLPGPEHPMEAFDAMVEVAHVFARNFNAELHDESHSDLTPQTIEHCRHRIREFCRKQKMNTASV